ncbi:class I SAM-dependent methyltransferase [Nonomuraea solani]
MPLVLLQRGAPAWLPGVALAGGSVLLGLFALAMAGLDNVAATIGVRLAWTAVGGILLGRWQALVADAAPESERPRWFAVQGSSWGIAQPTVPGMVAVVGAVAPANCTYVVGEGQSLPFPDASFDLVVSSLAVHHMPREARPEALRQMFRVLRPGGRLLIAAFRPPIGRLARRLVGLLSGPAMRHDPMNCRAPRSRTPGSRWRSKTGCRT